MISLSLLVVYVGYRHNYFLQLGQVEGASDQSISNSSLYGGHRHKYILQPGQAEGASDQSIFVSCLWCPQTQIFTAAWSGILGRQQGPAVSLSVLVVYVGYRHKYILQPGKAAWASNQSVGISCLWWPQTQIFPAAWAGSSGQS